VKKLGTHDHPPAGKHTSMVFEKGQPDFFLIVGLGNPGVQYELTRHNAGFLLVDNLSETHSILLKEKRNFPDLLFGQGKIGTKTVFLAKSLSFMNRSGLSIYRLADYYKIFPHQMIVVHDEVDLPFQSLKIKLGGGDGGHKGLRSIINTFGTTDFLRFRMGVGRSLHGEKTADHVLSRFSSDELDLLEEFLKLGSEAILAVLTKGQQEAMNKYNRRSVRDPEL